MELKRLIGAAVTLVIVTLVGFVTLGWVEKSNGSRFEYGQNYALDIVGGWWALVLLEVVLLLFVLAPVATKSERHLIATCITYYVVSWPILALFTDWNWTRELIVGTIGALMILALAGLFEPSDDIETKQASAPKKSKKTPVPFDSTQGL